MSPEAQPGGPTVTDVMAVADFRAAIRHFLRQSERIARQCGLTPQRYSLLLMIKGSPTGNEQSTVTELSERLQLAQSTVTELVRRAEEAGLVEREQSRQVRLPGTPFGGSEKVRGDLARTDTGQPYDSQAGTSRRSGNGDDGIS